VIYGWPELVVVALEIGAVAFVAWRIAVAVSATLRR
jgi:hypothetical protein